jgi:hypothetical protein
MGGRVGGIVGCFRPAPALFLAGLLMFAPLEKLRAQVLPAAAGAVGGFFAGTFVTTGVVVLEARLGRYIYGLDELVAVRPEVLPIVIFPVVGAVVGATSPHTLRRAGFGALVGTAGGAVIGTGLGQLIWSTSEGRWAGGIIGGATGMLAGAIIYASSGRNKGDGDPVPIAAVSIKLPRGDR